MAYSASLSLESNKSPGGTHDPAMDIVFLPDAPKVALLHQQSTSGRGCQDNQSTCETLSEISLLLLNMSQFLTSLQEEKKYQKLGAVGCG